MGLPDDTRIDVHQHLWPAPLIAALRARTRPPRLHDWTLILAGEPPYPVRPVDHDPAARRSLDGEASLALVSLSSPLGVEDLPPAQAQPLIDAWHAGAFDLPAGFGAWAAVSRIDPDLAGLADLFARGLVGLQVPAPWLATPALLERLAPVLAACEAADKPVLVHPGATPPPGTSISPGTSVPPSAATAHGGSVDELPGWWPAVVDYVAQLQAAWWAWHIAGRALLPTLRIGFVAGAGLAPLQHERLTARGGRLGAVDPAVFVETSSYGPRAVDSLIRVLGIDAVIRGSDRPYAEPAEFGLGSAADHAIEISNPRRFLFGGRP